MFKWNCIDYYIKRNRDGRKRRKRQYEKRFYQKGPNKGQEKEPNPIPEWDNNLLSEEYFKQLTAEKQSIRFVKGFPVRDWVKKSSARNEALDTLVYAYAALHRLYQKKDRRTIWDNLEERGRVKGKLKENKGEKDYISELRSRKKVEKPKFVSSW